MVAWLNRAVFDVEQAHAVLANREAPFLTAREGRGASAATPPEEEGPTSSPGQAQDIGRPCPCPTLAGACTGPRVRAGGRPGGGEADGAVPLPAAPAPARHPG